MNPYASTLLNDLHHHFPELLYRSERFHTVQDVLQYIVGVAQESPFERERQRYHDLSSSISSSSEQEQKDQEQKDQEQKDQEEEEKREETAISSHYEFTASSSAYAVSPPSSTPSCSSSSSSSPPSSSSSSSSTNPIQTPSRSTSLLEALLPLFQRRPYSSSNRFRLSVPLSVASLSSEYSVPAPSSLQGLSQLQELLQPVVIRPTERHLAENTYVYRSEIPLNDNCSICQDPMEAGQETRTIFACSHCFHRECIDKWFEGHVQCPTCRHDVREP